jgi:hypothetical protein
MGEGDYIAMKINNLKSVSSPPHQGRMNDGPWNKKSYHETYTTFCGHWVK